MLVLSVYVIHVGIYLGVGQMMRWSNTWTVNFISPLTLDCVLLWYVESMTVWSPNFLPFGEQKNKSILSFLGSPKYHWWYLIIFIINVYGTKLCRTCTENCMSFRVLIHFTWPGRKESVWALEITSNLKWHFFVTYFYTIPYIYLFWW